MRISTSENYYHEYDCCLSDCDRRYCDEHRLLWRDCDTAKTGWEGDRDVINGTREIMELGDCPKCEADSKRKRLYRDLVSRYWADSVCPECFDMKREADDLAVHLISEHGYNSERATAWLRGEVERKGGSK